MYYVMSKPLVCGHLRNLVEQSVGVGKLRGLCTLESELEILAA